MAQPPNAASSAVWGWPITWEANAQTAGNYRGARCALRRCAMAGRLYISPHAVNTHLRRVFAKLGVPDRVALAALVPHSIE